jgi:hypothetical protein
MPGTIGWLVCTARRTNGEPCRAPVIRGARVCRAHGGLAGHVREAARLRLERLVEPSIGTVREIMLRGETHAVRLKAATEILDRAGIVAEQKVEVDNQVTITVSYEDVELARNVIEHKALEPPGNGKTPHAGGAEERNGRETDG